MISIVSGFRDRLFLYIHVLHEAYPDYRVSAIEATHRPGREVQHEDEPVKPRGRIVNQRLVHDLVEKNKHYYLQYVGKETP